MTSWLRIYHALFLITVALCLASPAAIFSKEPAKATLEAAIPDPMDLSASWWNYFQVEPDVLAKRVTAFTASLKAKIPSVSAEHQQQVTDLVLDIEQNLTVFMQNLAAPPPETPQTKALPEHIAVDEALELFRALRLLSNDIATTREDLAEKQRTAEAMTLYLERQRNTYSSIKEPSEQKLIAGLQTIFYQIGVANARQEIVLLQARLKTQEETRKRSQNELTYALEHLSVTSEQIESSQRDVEKAQHIWSNAKVELAETISQHSMVQKFSTQEATQANTALVEQQILSRAIAEKLTQNRLLLEQIQLALEKLIFFGETVDANAIYAQTVQQQAAIDEIERQESEWQASAQKQVQRALQAISLIGDDSTSKPVVNVYRNVLKLSHDNLLALQHLSSDIGEANFLLTQLNKRLTSVLGGQTTNLWQILAALSTGFSRIKEWLQAPLFYLGETPLTPLALLRFIAIVLLASWIGRYVVAAVMRVAQTRAGVRKSLVYNVNRLIRYSIFLLGLLIAFASLGVDFSNLVLILSAIGVGVGFGIQSIATNFLSGIIILFEGTLRVGDYIELENGPRGEIKEINLRSSTMTTNDGIDVLIPNSQLLSTRVSNWTLTDPFRAVCVPFTVAYGTDQALVSQIVIEAAKKVPLTLGKPTKPDPNVHLLKLGEYGLEFQLMVWVNERASTRTRYTVSDYLKAISAALAEHNITIPCPRYDIRVIEKKSSPPPSS